MTSREPPHPGSEDATQQQPPPSHPSQSRFESGFVLADRYRIVSLLGRGGMGEVYRADDLKLAVPVALKFLPAVVEEDPRWLDRFLGEVRIARTVSHPSVCRVFDVGNVEGRHFLSMELIEGEDLGSLLRRIGRLPEEKALETARQLCAGLAAAHECGVIHRDFKPSNVMIDKSGRARITDFGLAVTTSELSLAMPREGTPAYMSPEQLEEREVTARSDIYALGLVLYELFTGKRPFKAGSREDLLHLQLQSHPPSPTSVVEGLDPRIERTILACLAPRPEQRPRSALLVAAMLPGGNPLQAALEAGQTPSPDDVAGATVEGALTPLQASATVALIVGLLAFVVAMTGRMKLHNQIPLPLSPEQLVFRAEQTLAQAGVDVGGRQRAWGWDLDFGLLEKLETEKRSSAEWTRVHDEIVSGRTPAIHFWYQSNQTTMVPSDTRMAGHSVPHNDPGDAWLTLDPNGRIRELAIVPDAEAKPGAEPDWSPFLARTVLANGVLTPDPPRWRPPMYADARRAWAESGPRATRIEAAYAGDGPVWLVVLGPDEKPARATGEQPMSKSTVLFLGLLIAFYLSAITLAVVLAWRNVRAGRSDRRGAFRIAIFLLCTEFMAWVIGGTHVSGFSEIALLVQALMNAVFVAVVSWLLYIALEPVIRRVWPQRLISWSRVLVHSWHDPMVGRDILAGVAAGLILSGSNLIGAWSVARELGRDWSLSSVFDATLEGPRGVAYMLFASTIRASIIVPFAILVFIVLIGLVVRRMTLAALIFWILFTCVLSLDAPNLPLNWVNGALAAGAMTLALTRFGLLAGVVTHAVFFFTFYYPITTNVSAWYFPAGLFGLVATVTLAIYGFTTAIGTRGPWLSEDSLLPR